MFFFSKMQATGNDFIIINYIENKLEYSLKLLSEYLCNRHFGIGADGVIILDRSDLADFRMRIFNADGNEAEMCGNGIRCLSKYIYERNLTNKKSFNIETKAGIKEIKLEVEGKTVISVKVDMGHPILNFTDIPVFITNYKEKEDKKIYIKKYNMEVFPVSIGNPHAVCFVDKLSDLEIEKIGKYIEEYKAFPNNTNVEFLKIINKNNISIRVWERGVGETLACGTGACAASIISILYKFTDSELTVDLRGGKIKTIYENEKIYLIGNSEFVYEGKIEI